MPKQKSKGLPPLYRRRQNSLSPKQKATQRIALEVLSEVRQTGKSLSKTSKEKQISASTVIRYTNAFRKRDSRWIATKSDKIPRSMIIYKNGKERSIEVSNSRYASIIGEYHNAVKEYLNNGKLDALNQFKKRKVEDIDGKYHRFETRPDKLKAILEAIEEPEFYEIYST